jgi:sortase A
MIIKKLMLLVAALAMVTALAACGSSGDSSGGSEKKDKSSESAKKKPETTKKEETGKKKDKKKRFLAEPAEDPTLSLSIPKLDKEIEEIPTGRGDDTQLLEENAAVHLLYTEYSYEVYEKMVVRPTDVEVLDRVPGKNVVTLQTCELVKVDENGNPDYSNTERLVVRGELKDVKS